MKMNLKTCKISIKEEDETLFKRKSGSFLFDLFYNLPSGLLPPVHVKKERDPEIPWKFDISISYLENGIRSQEFLKELGRLISRVNQFEKDDVFLVSHKFCSFSKFQEAFLFDKRELEKNGPEDGGLQLIQNYIDELRTSDPNRYAMTFLPTIQNQLLILNFSKEENSTLLCCWEQHLEDFVMQEKEEQMEKNFLFLVSEGEKENLYYQKIIFKGLDEYIRNSFMAEFFYRVFTRIRWEEFPIMRLSYSLDQQGDPRVVFEFFEEKMGKDFMASVDAIVFKLKKELLNDTFYLSLEGERYLRFQEAYVFDGRGCFSAKNPWVMCLKDYLSLVFADPNTYEMYPSSDGTTLFLNFSDRQPSCLYSCWKNFSNRKSNPSQVKEDSKKKYIFEYSSIHEPEKLVEYYNVIDYKVWVTDGLITLLFPGGPFEELPKYDKTGIFETASDKLLHLNIQSLHNFSIYEEQDASQN